MARSLPLQLGKLLIKWSFDKCPSVYQENIPHGRMDWYFHVFFYTRSCPYHLNVAPNTKLIRPGNVFAMLYCQILLACRELFVGPRYFFISSRSWSWCYLEEWINLCKDIKTSSFNWIKTLRSFVLTECVYIYWWRDC